MKKKNPRKEAFHDHTCHTVQRQSEVRFVTAVTAAGSVNFFPSGVNLSKNTHFFVYITKAVEIQWNKGVKSLAWKSGCVQISCLPQHHCHHKSRCQYHSEKRISSPNLTGTHYQGVPPSIAFEMIIINLALVIGCQRCFENFGFLRHRWLFACVQT